MTNSKQSERWWSKEFSESKICKSYGACFECCDFEEIIANVEAFISHVESETRKRTIEEFKLAMKVYPEAKASEVLDMILYPKELKK